MSPHRPALSGSCHRRTGDPAVFDQDYVNYLAMSFETQTYVYEQASGWIYWTWKTEVASDWSFQDGITYGWIPQPVTAKPNG